MRIAIRLRGNVGIKNEFKYTLKLLRLNKQNHAVLLKEKPEIQEMLKKVEPYITWGLINKKMQKK